MGKMTDGDMAVKAFDALGMGDEEVHSNICGIISIEGYVTKRILETGGEKSFAILDKNMKPKYTFETSGRTYTINHTFGSDSYTWTPSNDSSFGEYPVSGMYIYGYKRIYGGTTEMYYTKMKFVADDKQIERRNKYKTIEGYIMMGPDYYGSASPLYIKTANSVATNSQDDSKSNNSSTKSTDMSIMIETLKKYKDQYSGSISSDPFLYLDMKYANGTQYLPKKDYIPDMKNKSTSTITISSNSGKVTSEWAGTTFTKTYSDKKIPIYEWYPIESTGHIAFYTSIRMYVREDAPGASKSNTVSGWLLINVNNTVGLTDSLGGSLNSEYKNTEDELKNENTDSEEQEQTLDPLTEVNDINEWVANNMSAQYAEELQYFEDLYGGYETVWSTRSFRSIIGMPFHFLQSTDPRVGSSCLGKQFIEDIVYDMPLVCLRPGGPVMNSSISGSSSSGGVLGLVKKFLSYHSYFINNNASTLATMLDAGDDTEVDSGDDTGLVDGVKTVLTNLFVGKYARYYTFGSDMTKYVEYVNTLCHIFISFLGIGDMYYTPGTQYESGSTQPEPRKYAYYNDTWETVEADGGDSMRFMQGPNQAIFGYYQPESQLNQTYSNTTRDSEMASAIDQGSSIAKEFHFLMGTATDKLTDLSNGIFESLGQLNGNALVGRLFGNAAEGISTVIAGNNIDLPQIWDDSSGGAEHTLVFKLVSPYGDRESIFLYVLRPLARLLAMSLPRQFGPNSYTSPFLVQAFSKGQFNVQCGIVSSISIRRCGNGGESHTVHYIPTELEVTMTIQDMYGLVTLSNEYLGSANNTDGILAHIASAIDAITPFGAAKAARLLFNNIGLIDFCAAYCGYNLNAPEIDTMWTLLMDIWANRINDLVENPLTTGTSQWKSPKWAREMTDAFYGAVQKYLGFISG